MSENCQEVRQSRSLKCSDSYTDSQLNLTNSGWVERPGQKAQLFKAQPFYLLRHCYLGALHQERCQLGRIFSHSFDTFCVTCTSTAQRLIKENRKRPRYQHHFITLPSPFSISRYHIWMYFLFQLRIDN